MMPMDFQHDREASLLASLPDYEPDRQCSDRIRGRCHAALAARRREMEAPRVRAEARSWRVVFESAVVVALGAGYLTEVARHALAIYGR
jgi:hypothetical protein